MKYLVVNADDLGADEERNAGIFDAIQAGAVTSVSILANGPALEDALRRIHRLGPQRVSLGIHVNLSQGNAMARGLRRLSGPDGMFLGKGSARQLLCRCGDRDLERDIRRELSAQVARVVDSGLAIDHLDGHQHVHVMPAVIQAAMDTMEEFGISWVRIPEESCAPQANSFAPQAVIEEGNSYSRRAAAARPFYAARGIRSPDHFRGLYMKGDLPAERWDVFMRTLPQGLTELMVHPGYRSHIAGPFGGFSTVDRERELAALLDGRFLAALKQSGILLTGFPAASGEGSSCE